MAIQASNIKKATKVIKKLKCLITGQTGAGKTTSALLIAKGITNSGRILVFDTENGRASLKTESDVAELEGIDFDVYEMSPQEVTSQDYIDVITLAETQGFDCVILDTATHEWEYVKDLHQKLGGRFTDWGKAKQGHHKFVKKIISSKVHVILTARSDIKHEQQEINGKKQVVKLGLNPQTNSNFAYEMDFVFDIQDRQHNAICDKSEGGLFTEPLFVISEKTGVVLGQYLNKGVDPELETKKKYISRIYELESALLGAEALSAEELKGIEKREPNTLISLPISELAALGVSLGVRAKDLKLKV